MIQSGGHYLLKLSYAVIFLFAFPVAEKTIAADALPERCLKCHTEAAILAKVAKIEAENREKKLDFFLTKHYAADAAERAAIVAALKAMAEKR